MDTIETASMAFAPRFRYIDSAPLNVTVRRIFYGVPGAARGA